MKNKLIDANSNASEKIVNPSEKTLLKTIVKKMYISIKEVLKENNLENTKKRRKQIINGLDELNNNRKNKSIQEMTVLEQALFYFYLSQVTEEMTLEPSAKKFFQERKSLGEIECNANDIYQKYSLLTKLRTQDERIDWLKSQAKGKEMLRRICYKLTIFKHEFTAQFIENELYTLQKAESKK